MKLSIIIPYYNGEQWVGKCLDSLLKQDLRPEDYEIIVVDDGSTHSIEVLMKYVNDYPQIHYLHQQNQKHAAARNHGLSIAQGDYVFFCDCDDYVTDNVLGRLCDMAIEEKADVFLFNYHHIKESENLTALRRNFEDKRVFDSGLVYMSRPPFQFRGGVWQFLIRRSFMEEKGVKFAPEMISFEEHLFFLQMMLAAGKVVKVDVDVYYYVKHPSSWAHLEGKISNCDAYNDCRAAYLEHLTRTRKKLAQEGIASPELIEEMAKREADETFIILHNKFRYSTVKSNKATLALLSAQGYYPIRRKMPPHDWLRRIMNKYPLWMAACYCYHILPQKVRERLI